MGIVDNDRRTYIIPEAAVLVRIITRPVANTGLAMMERLT